MKRRTFSPGDEKPALSDDNLSGGEIPDSNASNHIPKRLSRSRSYSNSAANVSSNRGGGVNARSGG